MKKYLLVISMVFVWSILNAQINLEHTYLKSDIRLVDLGDSVYNYLKLEVNNYQYRYTLYHMNHSVNVSDTLPMRGNPDTWIYVYYFSRSLFDCDTSNIEFLLVYCVAPPSGYSYVSIYRTDGTRLFMRDSAAFGFSTTGDNSYIRIVKTPVGTKMILPLINNNTEVYNLCGTLPTGMSVNKPDDYNGLSSPYPNPAMSYTRIDYKLPEDVSSGELVFYDTRGIEVKRFKVDHNFTDLQLNTSDLRAGTYYYNLQIHGKVTEGKKLVVIK